MLSLSFSREISSESDFAVRIHSRLNLRQRLVAKVLVGVLVLFAVGKFRLFGVKAPLAFGTRA